MINALYTCEEDIVCNALVDFMKKETAVVGSEKFAMCIWKIWEVKYYIITGGILWPPTSPRPQPAEEPYRGKLWNWY